MDKILIGGLSEGRKLITRQKVRKWEDQNVDFNQVYVFPSVFYKRQAKNQSEHFQQTAKDNKSADQKTGCAVISVNII